MLKLVGQNMSIHLYLSVLTRTNSNFSTRSQRRQAKVNKILMEKKKQSIKKYEQLQRAKKQREKPFVKIKQTPYILQQHFYFKEINELQKIEQLQQQRLFSELIRHNDILEKLAQARYSEKQFENIWKKYNFYVSIVFEKVIQNLQEPLSLGTVSQILRFFVNITTIHGKFPSIKSQNLTKTMNRAAHIVLSHLDNLNFCSILAFINGCYQYNPKKAKVILLAKTNKINNKMASLLQQSKQNPKTALLLLKLMKQLDYHNNLYLQHALNCIYPHIGILNSNQIKNMLFCLASTHSFINKRFFLKTVSRLINLIKSNNMKDQDIFRCGSSVSIIQKNMSGLFLNELQGFYEYFISEFCQKVDSMWSRQLAAFANVLRRANVYHPLAIQALINECLARQVVDFQESSQQIELFDQQKKINPVVKAKQKIELQCILIVFHMLATLNHRNEKFIEYTLQIIQLSFCKQKKKWISFELASRTIWSACVLCTKQQVSKLFPMIQNYFENRIQPADEKHQQNNNNYKPPSLHESLNYYYSFVYLKTFFPKITVYNERLKEIFNQEKLLKSKISKFHQDIHKIFIECGIPAIKQFNISNLMVDIFIPQYEGIRNIVIQVHGFQHFLRDFSTTELRNAKTHRNLLKLDGSSILKKKLIQSEGYLYFYISLDEWLLIQNSKDQVQFIKTVMERIKNKYSHQLSKIFEKKNVATRKVRRIKHAQKQ